MNLFPEIVAARKRIRNHVLRTPLYLSDYLSNLSGGKVYLKLESEQYTGSFKARGAANKILSASEAEKKQGFITAPTGNHAQGFARALNIAEASGTIFLPENASPAKVEALKSYPVQLEFFGNNSLETELHAKSVSEERGLIWVSPYNDPLIVAGQGTIGLEMHEQATEPLDYVFGCIGGGGMMAGVAMAMKSVSPTTKIIGCLPEKSPEMYLSVKAGKVVFIDFEETLSDGSAGGLEDGSITFPICQQNVDSYTLVTEEEIAESIRLLARKHHKIIEGAAGVAVAAFLKNIGNYREKNVAIIICGANIAIEKLKQIL